MASSFGMATPPTKPLAPVTSILFTLRYSLSSESSSNNGDAACTPTKCDANHAAAKLQKPVSTVQTHFDASPLYMARFAPCARREALTLIKSINDQGMIYRPRSLSTTLRRTAQTVNVEQTRLIQILLDYQQHLATRNATQ